MKETKCFQLVFLTSEAQTKTYDSHVPQNLCVTRKAWGVENINETKKLFGFSDTKVLR